MVRTAVRTPGGTVRHAPRLHQGFYARGPETSLHRYLDDQFVPRFLHDAQQGRLTGTPDQPWFTQDRFGRFQDHPALRLPMHRAFYLACCEVSCLRFRQPAFDPQRITSAGLVVRRVLRDGTIQRWMLQDGQALGWSAGPIPTYEPSDYRRMLNHRLVQPRFPEPSYSGEETYPMHPLPVQRPGAGGKLRRHTLLWGYLPLGGSYREQQQPVIPASGAGAPTLAMEHAWPFGLQQAHPWRTTDGLQADHGLATEGLQQLLETLLFRYRITEVANPDNGPLRTLLGRIHFFAQGTSIGPAGPVTQFLVPTQRKESLFEYLTTSGDAVGLWLTQLARGETSLASAPLPLQTGKGPGGELQSTPRQDTLWCTQADARDLRDLLVQRTKRAMTVLEEGMALPRFGQGQEDTFIVVPFVRWLDVCGCERISWGPASTRFRVASPLDPDAQRPTAIQLPGLDDLRRGSAKGLAMLAPKSLADILTKIKPDLGLKAGGGGNKAGICMSFSFSLPAITLCAMVLLMVILNLLNLFFWWLPWAFLALPRLCLKSEQGA